MKVFLSHSGKKSLDVAKLLKKWLPEVIQAIEPWLSEDIQKGAKWRERINQALGESNIGIICLTSTNLSSQWLLFESGSLSREEDAILCTFLIDIEYEDVKGPLESFQHTIFSKDDILKMLNTINSNLEPLLSERQLETAFNRLWPEFERDFGEICKKDYEENTKKPQKHPINEIIIKKTAEKEYPSLLTCVGTQITDEMSITEKIDKIQSQENWLEILKSGTENDLNRGIEKGYPLEYIDEKKHLLEQIKKEKKKIKIERAALKIN